MNWKTTLAAVAPTIATALGGPFAGAAVNAIGKALTGKEGNFDETIVSDLVLGANPDALVALKKADQDFAVKMKELDVRNTESARKMAALVGILPHILLSSIYTVGYFWMLYMFLKGEINLPADLADSFKLLLGVMTAAQAQIMNFWFGSSSGSKEKTGKL